MWRGVAGHGAGPPRPGGPADRAPPSLWGLPRWEQGQQHLESRSDLRPHGQGFPQGAGGAQDPVDAGHRVLGVQPLRRRRGVLPRSGPPQRPGQWIPDHQRRGVRPVLHRDRPHLRTQRGVRPRRPVSQSDRQPAPADQGVASGPCVRGPRGARVDHSRSAHPGLQQDLRRQRPGRGFHRLVGSAGGGDGAGADPPADAEPVAGRRPATSGTQAGADRDRPVLLARAAPAGRVLRFALRGRHRVAHPAQSAAGPAALGPPGHQFRQPDPHRVLRGRDGAVLRTAGCHRGRDLAAQPACAAAGCAGSPERRAVASNKIRERWSRPRSAVSR